MTTTERRGALLLASAAVIFGLFALGYLLAPERLTKSFSIEYGAIGATDIRATYGGLQAGVAIFLLWSSRSAERIRGGLVILLSTTLAVAVFRGAGVIGTGLLGPHWIGFAFELPLALLSAWGLQSSRATTPADPRESSG